MSSARHFPLPLPAPTAACWSLCLHAHQGVPLFADWRCARAAAASLALPGQWPGARLLCWVLLPQRWCALVQAPGKATVLQLALAARQAAGDAVNRARGRGGTVWQPDIEATALAPQADHRHFARSLVALPLRAGLAERIGAYPYWDAVWLPDQRAAAALLAPAPHPPAQLAATSGAR
ncbi:hypothetical protein [Xanthomonas cannabis]|uniref:hypothetical protein n=1 Tax=Xanthomonas cannabis TaxID=1885674 RepID=UPI00141B6F75|nr:hypothetical protein [Xanthomonas cannabis]